ncbi:MAG: RND transporter [Ignavibacteriaceae bacterium]|nr:MAG: efflux RND transporter periplasmic adaptor subunit [Chlorobiota bacterium]GJQ32411.1 MAG: RND transporter [Ignavibacteriaceae bacterium]
MNNFGIRTGYRFVLIPLAAALFFAGCGDDTKDTDAKKKKPEKTAVVQAQPIKFESFTGFIDAIGQVKPDKVSKVGSATGGKIVKFNVDKGSRVAAGTVICVIDNAILKANLDAAKADLDLSEINLKKQEQIYRQNAGTEFQYLQAKYTFEAKKASFEAIKEQYSNTFIKAPFAGVVDTKHYEIGEVAAPGAPIVTIISDALKVEAGIPEKYITSLKPGKKGSLIFAELDSLQVNSTISYVAKSVDATSRTVKIEMRLPNPARFKPEMNAEVRIDDNVYSSVPVIPEEVIVKTDLGYVVFVAVKRGNTMIAEMREVEILSRSNNRVAVSGNLNEGEQLITVGYQTLVNGEKITVK